MEVTFLSALIEYLSKPMLRPTLPGLCCNPLDQPELISLSFKLAGSRRNYMS